MKEINAMNDVAKRHIDCLSRYFPISNDILWRNLILNLVKFKL